MLDTGVYDYSSPPVMPSCGNDKGVKVKYLPENVPNYSPPFVAGDQHYVTRTGCKAPMNIEREVSGIVEGFGSGLNMLFKILILLTFLYLVYLIVTQMTMKVIDVPITADTPNLSAVGRT